MAERGGSRVHERWARLRFSVIGALLAAPPAKGALRAALQQLAAREWRHPSTGAPVRFGVSTLERWYYRSRNEQHDPVSVLRRKRRQDAGEQVSMTPALRQALLAQYNAHKSWSAQLHHDNLVALAETRSELRPVPSYATVRRFLAAHGLTRRRPMTTRQTDGALAAAARLEAREVRSYEAEYVNGTWHWDCHHGSRKVLTQRGEWRTPILFGVLDDRSRLVCHLQWYLSESAENIAHGLSQAMQKRGLPRAAMSDNGAAMTATEITEGLARLGIIHQTTLPYSPYQNGKQEVLWGSVEGRLMAMLEGVDDLTMARLNEATQAWVEQDYNRKRHSEIDDTPLARFLAGPAVTRPCPDAAALRLAFTRTEQRTLRKSDGTAVIEGRRFEVPNRYRHLSVLEVRFAAWDLTQVHLVDPPTGTVLCRLFPQDKVANASGLRRSVQPISAEPVTSTTTAGTRHRTAAGENDRPAGSDRPAARLPPEGRRRRCVNNKMLALYGLKWNPFAPNVPTEALHVTPRLELFCWRVQQLAGEGGFALVTGAPGCGKSGALRILSASLATQRDVTVGVISRPQANIADFYREMGELFGVELRPHNRYGGAKILRQRWQAHIQSTLSRPVLVVDEAQEMQSAVLAELRLLASADLDSNILLTTVLAGDGRLAERLRADEFLPLASRMRVRLPIERTPPQDLQDCLRHALQQAGAPTLMTPEVIATICDHALGNLRALMIMAGELLATAAQREARQIDETLFFETCGVPAASETKAAIRRRR